MMAVNIRLYAGNLLPGEKATETPGVLQVLAMIELGEFEGSSKTGELLVSGDGQEIVLYGTPGHKGWVDHDLLANPLKCRSLNTVINSLAADAVSVRPQCAGLVFLLNNLNFLGDNIVCVLYGN
jgi:hypothetical protein